MQEIKSSDFIIPRKSKVYTSGAEGARRRWLCCHGYGQLADWHVRKFSKRVLAGDFIACPEGNNRFYWNGVSGQQATTWMTSRYRLDEIAENNIYLQKVYDKLIKGAEEIVLCGFSQGATTVWRWIEQARPKFDLFINYGGWMPDDIELRHLVDYLSDRRLVHVYGEEDEYLTTDRVEALKIMIAKSGLNIQLLCVEGGHSIDRQVLEMLMDEE